MNNPACENSAVADVIVGDDQQFQNRRGNWRKNRRVWHAALRAFQILWLSVVPGILVGTSTLVFIYLLVFGYYVLSPEESENVKTARALGGSAIPVVFFALSLTASSFITGYLKNSRACSLGLLSGLVAGVTEQTIVTMNHPPLVALELLAYLLTGACFGILGGWLGGRESEKSAAGERALYHAMREIGSASDSKAVARAIGSLFGGTVPVGVALWLDAPEGKEIGHADAVWQSDPRRLFSPRRSLKVANDVALLPAVGVRSLRATKLQHEGRNEWEQQGLKSALVSPLLYSGRESSGLLFVGFGEAGRASRASAARKAKRRLLTAAAGAAMALEKEKSGKVLGVLQERQRVSREIHDTLLQYLITTDGELMTAKLAARSGAHLVVDTHFERAREGVRRGTEEARRLMREMRPEVLDGSSLPEALSTLTRRVAEESHVRVTCEVRGTVRPLAPEVEHALTRITEEALANIRKHACASRAHASLEFQSAGVTLVVSDDGVGLRDPSERVRKEEGNFGLRSMMERAGSIGGQLRIESLKDKGTVVVVHVATNAGEA